MTAATGTPWRPAARASPRGARRGTARIRAVILFAFGVVGLLPRRAGASTRPRRSRSGSTSRAARAPRSQTAVGVLWIVAGLVSWFVAVLQLLRGAPFRWRPWLLLLVWPWVAAILADVLGGKPANLTGMIAGSLEFAVPITLGALAGILSERSGMLNIALEGKMLVGACVASVAASVGLIVTGQRPDRGRDRHRRGHAGRGRRRASSSPGWASATRWTRSSRAP